MLCGLAAVLAVSLLLADAAPATALRRAWERGAWHLRGWCAGLSLPGPGREVGHFRLWAGEEDVTPDLERQLEEAYDWITGDLGVRPSRPVRLVLYGEGGPPRAPGAAGSAAGVYAAGVIHLVRRGDLRGPLVHEMTHYLLDLAAPGRVPRWFQEGLAQLEEYRFTGVLLYAPAPAPTLPLARLEAEFERLPEHVAFGVSLSLVESLYRAGGEDAFRRLVGALAGGAGFEEAVRAVWGLDPRELDGSRRGKTPAGVGDGGLALPGST